MILHVLSIAQRADLGPVLVACADIEIAEVVKAAGGTAIMTDAALHELVPWFIVGFLLVLAVRSFGLIPDALLPPIKVAASLLTTVSMAALGLGVDVRVVAKAGVRVTAAVTLSLVVLGGISVGLIRLLGVA